MTESDSKASTSIAGGEITNLRSTWRGLPEKETRKNAYVTALTGELIGRTYQIGSGRLFIGRANDCDIALDDDGVSRRHALIISGGEGAVHVEDLQSKNGMTVNGKLCSRKALRDGDRLQFGSNTIFKFELRDAIEEQYATYLFESATKDRLTGIFNERYLREQLVSEFAWHKRHDLSLSLIFIDIDHFKSVNDEFGHLSGDEVLRQVVKRIQAESRTEDIFARYGGEEFACLLRRTDVATAYTIAERMREAVARAPISFAYNGEMKHREITISAGVTVLGRKIATPEALIAAADRLLYRAKAKGRNSVVSSQLGAVPDSGKPPPDTPP